MPKVYSILTGGHVWRDEKPRRAPESAALDLIALAKGDPIDALDAELSARARRAVAAEGEARRLSAELAQMGATPPASPAASSARPRPEDIKSILHRDGNGYLSRVVLRAEGYDDATVDVVRDAANRVRDLKIS